MPNIITHTLFSQDVYSELGSLKELVESRIQLFEIGSNGPDFLFFHGLSPKHYLKQSSLRSVGSKAHDYGTNDFYKKALECVRKETSEDVRKDMMVYVFGHLCHWALDSTSHPYVYYKTGNYSKKGSWWHHRFESLIDAIILKAKNDCTIQDFKAYEICEVNLEIARAITRVYVPIAKSVYETEIKPHQILESLNDWCSVQKLLYDPKGTKFNLTNVFEKITNTESMLSGYFVPNSPEDPFDTMNLLHNEWCHPCDDKKVSTESFFDLYDKAISVATNAIQLFYQAIDSSDHEQEFLSFLGNKDYCTGMEPGQTMSYFDTVYD